MFRRRKKREYKPFAADKSGQGQPAANLLSRSRPEKNPAQPDLSRNFHKPAGKSLSRRLTSLISSARHGRQSPPLYYQLKKKKKKLYLPSKITIQRHSQRYSGRLPEKANAHQCWPPFTITTVNISKHIQTKLKQCNVRDITRYNIRYETIIHIIDAEHILCGLRRLLLLPPQICSERNQVCDFQNRNRKSVLAFPKPKNRFYRRNPVLGNPKYKRQKKQESVRPRWPYDMRPSVRAEKYIRDASG